jgi:hypothetical protein
MRIPSFSLSDESSEFVPGMESGYVGGMGFLGRNQQDVASAIAVESSDTLEGVPEEFALALS